MAFESKIKTIEWLDNSVKMIDQTKLPYSFETVELFKSDEVAQAIKTMIVRGAPAIGIAGAHGVTLAALELSKESDKKTFLSKLKERAEFLKSTRPTAVNLMWAVDKQMQTALDYSGDDVEGIIEALKQNGIMLENQDIEINKKIGDFGAEIVPEGATILTHCNAGALATVGYGTALGVVRSAYAKDNTIRVFADETRPRQQGARLTTFELIEDGIPTTLITDGMCGYFMKNNMIDVVVVGADRIALNGDTANKIGTYTVALAAKAHNIPFYIAAPLSTIDISIENGEQIPIEERERDEVTHINGKPICHRDVNVINPAFDVTPNEYITGIITEKGILRAPYKESILNAMKY